MWSLSQSSIHPAVKQQEAHPHGTTKLVVFPICSILEIPGDTSNHVYVFYPFFFDCWKCPAGILQMKPVNLVDSSWFISVSYFLTSFNYQVQRKAFGTLSLASARMKSWCPCRYRFHGFGMSRRGRCDISIHLISGGLFVQESTMIGSNWLKIHQALAALAGLFGSNSSAFGFVSAAPWARTQMDPEAHGE